MASNFLRLAFSFWSHPIRSFVHSLVLPTESDFPTPHCPSPSTFHTLALQSLLLIPSVFRPLSTTTYFHVFPYLPVFLTLPFTYLFYYSPHHHQFGSHGKPLGFLFASFPLSCRPQKPFSLLSMTVTNQSDGILLR